jgi:hypothetical protein
MKCYSYCEMTNWELDALWALFERTPGFYGEVPREQFNRLLSTGYMQLWVEPDPLNPVAAMVTEIRTTFEGKYAFVLAFAGDHDPDIEHKFLGSIQKWAVKNGCEKIRAICKEAQTRLFARKGFVKVANVIELELNDE